MDRTVRFNARSAWHKFLRATLINYRALGQGFQSQIGINFNSPAQASWLSNGIDNVVSMPDRH
jgi:hypothetical protein